MRRLILALALLTSSQGFANSKTLFLNGVYAASYGDIILDKGDWRGNDVSALKLRAGVQLIRFDPVSLTVGYQKSGFYDGMIRHDGSKTQFDYRGPVFELHLFPDAPFTFSAAYHQAQGFDFLDVEGAARSNCTPANACELKEERADLKISEYTGYVGAKVSRGLYVILGAGTRNVEGRPSFGVQRASGYEFERRASVAQWDDSGSFFLLGLRGSNL